MNQQNAAMSRSQRRWSSAGLATAMLAVACAARMTLAAPAAPPRHGPDLTLAPMRIVFEGRQRTAEIDLMNRGDAPGTYRISFTHLEMTADGRLVELTSPQPGARFADEFVRYSPRQITLEAGQTQVLRLQLRKPADLPIGEYRAHLRFVLVPNHTPEPTPEASEPTTTSIRLIPVYGVSIPVIVRHGDLAATVSISELNLQAPTTAPAAAAAPTGPTLSLRLDRTGSCSVYGSLQAQWVAPGRRPIEVGRINGLAVYVPNAGRPVTMALRLPADLPFDCGQLVVTFSEPGDGPAKVLATGTIEVAKGR